MKNENNDFDEDNNSNDGNESNEENDSNEYNSTNESDDDSEINEELEVDKTIKCKIAQKHLEESIKQVFAFSCFLELCKKAADEDHSIAQLKCKKNEDLMENKENKEERTFQMKYRATLDYAINLYNSKQYSQAFDYFSVLSSYNDPVAIYFVGVMMFNGFRCSMNRDKSYEIMCYLSSKGINKHLYSLSKNLIIER